MNSLKIGVIKSVKRKRMKIDMFTNDADRNSAMVLYKEEANANNPKWKNSDNKLTGEFPFEKCKAFKAENWFQTFNRIAFVWVNGDGNKNNQNEQGKVEWMSKNNKLWLFNRKNGWLNRFTFNENRRKKLYSVIFIRLLFDFQFHANDGKLNCFGWAWILLYWHKDPVAI